MWDNKVRPSHRNRAAIIYVRQSTLGQVRMHQESTERQYALRDRAQEMGWPTQAISVIDEDLGLSGSHSAGRTGFQHLVSDVSLGQVGAIFGLEVSRLARSNADWHRLLELCALFDTLIVDADGVYDLADFNDRLVLGLKGTMSEAELHVLRGRLFGGKLNKARKGELRAPLPVGFVFDPAGRIVLDPDEQVQTAIRSLFATFRRNGSAFGVVQHFARESLNFPKRAYGGAWAGRLLWGKLTHGRVLGVLKNPCYAGTYVFGRYHYRQKLGSDGRLHSSMVTVSPENWQVRIDGYHPGYLTLAEFDANQIRLQHNRTNATISGAAREGTALLQGLLLCGHCGRRLSVRYTSNGAIKVRYECGHGRRDGIPGPHCRSVDGAILDAAVSTHVLGALQPAELDLALQAVDHLHQFRQDTERAWQLRLERTQYEADLAERQYLLTEPENRLVARTMESRWNERLTELHKLQEEHRAYARRLTDAGPPLSPEQVLALARDLPRLWGAQTTSPKDRKRILRVLLADVTVLSVPGSREIRLGIRWRSGRSESVTAHRPLSSADRRRCPPETVARIAELARTLTDQQIIEFCNTHGWLSPTGKPFTRGSVQWIRYRHRIPGPQGAGQISVAEAASRLGVSCHVIYYWIKSGVLTASKTAPGSRWQIALNTALEDALRERIRRSDHIRHPGDLESDTPDNPKPAANGTHSVGGLTPDGASEFTEERVNSKEEAPWPSSAGAATALSY